MNFPAMNSIPPTKARVAVPKAKEPIAPTELKESSPSDFAALSDAASGLGEPSVTIGILSQGDEGEMFFSSGSRDPDQHGKQVQMDGLENVAEMLSADFFPGTPVMINRETKTIAVLDYGPDCVRPKN